MPLKKLSHLTDILPRQSELMKIERVKYLFKCCGQLCTDKSQNFLFRFCLTLIHSQIITYGVVLLSNIE